MGKDRHVIFLHVASSLPAPSKFAQAKYRNKVSSQGAAGFLGEKNKLKGWRPEEVTRSPDAGVTVSYGCSSGLGELKSTLLIAL